ncbi:unnamed protein product, partial [Prorocentrum cordatum]
PSLRPRGLGRRPRRVSSGGGSRGPPPRGAAARVPRWARRRGGKVLMAGDGKKAVMADLRKTRTLKDKGKKVPRAGKGKAPKRPKMPGDGSVTKRKKKAIQTYAIYIYKVLKQIHPECGISKRGMNIMNSFMNDIFERMATEATRLLRTTKKRRPSRTARWRRRCGSCCRASSPSTRCRRGQRPSPSTASSQREVRPGSAHRVRPRGPRGGRRARGAEGPRVWGLQPAPGARGLGTPDAAAAVRGRDHQGQR